MKRAMKVYTEDTELLIGFDDETGKAYLEIDSEVVQDLLQYDKVSKIGLKDMLLSFKNCINNALSELEKEK